MRHIKSLKIIISYIFLSIIFFTNDANAFSCFPSNDFQIFTAIGMLAISIIAILLGIFIIWKKKKGLIKTCLQSFLLVIIIVVLYLTISFFIIQPINTHFKEKDIAECDRAYEKFMQRERSGGLR